MQDNNFKFWAPNKYKNYTQLMVVFLIIVFIALIFMFINVDIGALLLMIALIYGILCCPLIIFVMFMIRRKTILFERGVYVFDKKLYVVMFTNPNFNNVESNKIYFSGISGMEEILNLSELPLVYEITTVKEVNKINNKKYKITLDLTVSDTDKQLSVFVKGIGIFETEQENQTLIERNTIAIMFPYLRSYVSTLTTQPGMAPIVLPPMNVVAMLNQK